MKKAPKEEFVFEEDNSLLTGEQFRGLSKEQKQQYLKTGTYAGLASKLPNGKYPSPNGKGM